MASISRRPGGRWRARYRDDTGREHARHFARKTDAQLWLDQVTAAVVTGAYVDPRAGRVTFRDYGETWRAAQVHRPTTRANVENLLRRHAYPILGDRPLSTIRPGDVQAWIGRLTVDLAPATVRLAHSVVAGIFRAAVRDRLIAASPCEHTRLPAAARRLVVPLDVDVVHAITAAMPGRWRAAVTLAAAAGLRQGETLGLTVDRVDWLRRSVRVDRQLVTMPGRPPYLAPPKTRASVRDVPVPQLVVDALAAHVAAHPPPAGGAVDPLLFTRDGRPVPRSSFGHAWRTAAAAAGAAGVRFHELRHFYASLLIRHGESVKVVQARLGHASAGETLNTYAHLWPDSDDRTRDAVTAALADFLRTAGGDGMT
jgi:integrase